MRWCHTIASLMIYYASGLQYRYYNSILDFYIFIIFLYFYIFFIAIGIWGMEGGKLQKTERHY